MLNLKPGSVRFLEISSHGIGLVPFVQLISWGQNDVPEFATIIDEKQQMCQVLTLRKIAIWLSKKCQKFQKNFKKIAKNFHFFRKIAIVSLCVCPQVVRRVRGQASGHLLLRPQLRGHWPVWDTWPLPEWRPVSECGPGSLVWLCEDRVPGRQLRNTWVVDR